MVIKECVKSIVYYVDTDRSGWNYFRRGAGEDWEILMGESWETIWGEEAYELEALFQEYLEQNPEKYE